MIKGAEILTAALRKVLEYDALFFKLDKTPDDYLKMEELEGAHREAQALLDLLDGW